METKQQPIEIDESFVEWNKQSLEDKAEQRFIDYSTGYYAAKNIYSNNKSSSTWDAVSTEIFLKTSTEELDVDVIVKIVSLLAEKFNPPTIKQIP